MPEIGKVKAVIILQDAECRMITEVSVKSLGNSPNSPNPIFEQERYH